MPPLPDKSDTAYWDLVRRWAHVNGSDGCTHALEFYVLACFEHDVHCRLRRTLLGDPISSRQAALRFRQVLQWESPLGKYSPASYWRWAAVRWLGPQWD